MTNYKSFIYINERGAILAPRNSVISTTRQVQAELLCGEQKMCLREYEKLRTQS